MQPFPSYSAAFAAHPAAAFALLSQGRPFQARYPGNGTFGVVRPGAYVRRLEILWRSGETSSELVEEAAFSALLQARKEVRVVTEDREHSLQLLPWTLVEGDAWAEVVEVVERVEDGTTLVLLDLGEDGPSSVEYTRLRGVWRRGRASRQSPRQLASALRRRRRAALVRWTRSDSRGRSRWLAP